MPTARSVPRVWLTASLACLCAALAAQAGRWSVLCDLLAEAAPLWALGSALALAASLTAPPAWRWRLAATAALGLAASAALIAPEFLRQGPASPAGDAPRLRIIQINIGGAGLRTPGPTAAWLAQQNPDLIFVDDADPPFRDALERRGFLWTRGTAWTGIASRRALSRSGVRFSAHDWRVMPDMARGRLETAGGPAELIAVHLTRPLPGLTPDDGRQSLVDLEALTGRYDRRRLILAGDLNLTPWSFRLRRLDRTLGLARRDRAAFTWPARLLGMRWPAPVMPLDHLYAGSAWRTVRVFVGPAIDATHRPLVVDLAPAL
jgi:endonuclease/exonuclease/phosphatase (EEP) superfamily protein YafD